jgi:photosystem II 13kDa protein
MPATIQFMPGVNEEVSDVRITGTKYDNRKAATFYFSNPKINTGGGVRGMRMQDDEGTLETTDVRSKFVNGEFTGLEAVYEMTTEQEFERFMRFMNRYAESNGMEFQKK